MQAALLIRSKTARRHRFGENEIEIPDMTNQTPPFAVGQRIKLLDMPDDPDPIPPGTTGTVLAVSSWLTGDSWAVTVDWDIDRSWTYLPMLTRSPRQSLFIARENSQISRLAVRSQRQCLTLPTASVRRFCWAM